MQTLFIDGQDYADAQALHRALQQLLHLPNHYGCNADALYDCLTSRQERVNLCIMHPGSATVAEALRKCALAVEDAGGQVKALG